MSSGASAIYRHVATARDGCVVPTEPLAAILGGFVTRWNRDRPSIGGKFTSAERRTEVTHVGAVAWIAEETRRNDPEGGVGIPQNTIENIVAGRYRTTELRVADAIVTAIGCPEVFHDGTLEIKPNPSASREARAACCGGSLNGAVSPSC